jgi:hypothetical protein
MYPSCSAYARKALEKHGPIIGWTMAVDRLLRCGRDEMDRSPRIFVNGRWKVYDPVEKNDRWWYGNGGGENPPPLTSARETAPALHR